MEKKYKIFIIGFLFLSFAFSSRATGVDTISGTISNGLSAGQQVVVVVGPPTVSPTPGIFSTTQIVALVKPSGAKEVRYTTNGATPNCTDSTIYSSPISVTATTSIKAISCYTNGSVSNVVTFPYIISISSTQLPELLVNGTFKTPEGEKPTEVTKIDVTKEVQIVVEKSTVTIPDKTVITESGGKPFDATALSAEKVSETSLSGLGTGKVVEGALQWGIAELHLSFNPAISLSIFVGEDLNGQTLKIQRSSSKTSGWTSDGIVSATCVIEKGFCNFQATSASYYATYRTVAVENPTSGGGGGSSPVPITPITQPAITKDKLLEMLNTALINGMTSEDKVLLLDALNNYLSQ